MENKLTFDEAMEHVDWWLKDTPLQAEGLDDTVSDWVYEDLEKLVKQLAKDVDDEDEVKESPFVTQDEVEELLHSVSNDVWNEHIGQKELDATYNSMLRQMSAGTF
jgi:hypothetical protein